MRRRELLFKSSGGGSADGSKAAPMEVVFAHNGGLVIADQKTWSGYSTSDYTPIGIVVVPGQHNRYGDGTCGVMSLKAMRYDSPISGGTENQYMYWGSYQSAIGNNIFASISYGTNYVPYQTNSASTAVSNNGSTSWPYDGTSTAPTSGASTDYSVEMSATTGNACADFNGIKNTAAIYVKTKDSSQWTDSTVTNATGSINTPAAACAGRFKTSATKSFLDVYSGITSNSATNGTSTDTHDYRGMWYLPACGELCYIPRYRHEINKTIKAITDRFGTALAGQLVADGYYWSSSEYDRYLSWRVVLGNGRVDGNHRDYNAYVRAFLRL